MKSFSVFIPIVVSVFIICGCANSDSSSSGYASSTSSECASISSQICPPSSVSNSPSSVSEEKPESFPDPALSKAPIVGAFRQDVDFLTEEQWTLYDKGRLYLYRFLFDAGHFRGDNNALSNIYKTIDGWHYYQYSSEKYPNYDAFYQDMLTVYTPEFYAEHNKTPGDSPIPIYVDIDGDLYYLDATGGASITYLSNWDRFELISKEETRIEFNLITYYCDFDAISDNPPIPVEMKRSPIVIEKTNNGWRISKFDYPN